jgi:hypothetical protein
LGRCRNPRIESFVRYRCSYLICHIVAESWLFRETRIDEYSWMRSVDRATWLNARRTRKERLRRSAKADHGQHRNKSKVSWKRLNRSSCNLPRRCNFEWNINSLV